MELDKERLFKAFGKVAFIFKKMCMVGFFLSGIVSIILAAVFITLAGGTIETLMFAISTTNPLAIAALIIVGGIFSNLLVFTGVSWLVPEPTVSKAAGVLGTAVEVVWAIILLIILIFTFSIISLLMFVVSLVSFAIAIYLKNDTKSKVGVLSTVAGVFCLIAAIWLLLAALKLGVISIYMIAIIYFVFGIMVFADYVILLLEILGIKQREPAKIICDFCGKEIGANKEFCGFCGRRTFFICKKCNNSFSYKLNYCPKCGTENSDKRTYCEQCGVVISAGEDICKKCKEKAEPKVSKQETQFLRSAKTEKQKERPKEGPKKANTQDFCENCGNAVDGEFCENCGRKA